ELDVFVLQVRPLAAERRWQKLEDAEINGAIAEVRREVRDLQQPQPGLAGATTIFGEMPDWNPAEMIGTTPRRLAESLYRRLITDRVWAIARSEMGYRDVHQPLMQTFAGRPYIDVRASVNSFLPGDIQQSLADRIVNIALDRLTEFPQHHDKIEFEIAITCRDLEYDRAINRYTEAGLTQSEAADWKDALTELTARHLQRGAEGIGKLSERPRRLLHEPGPLSGSDCLTQIETVLARTANNGTLPFAILARHAFIGMSFLRSLVSTGIFSAEDAENFMLGISTIATDVVNAMASVTTGQQSQDEFLARYGHLRPGTYDILSWRYDERPELYLGQNIRGIPAHPQFRLGAAQGRAIDAALAKAGIGTGAEGLLSYISASLSAREEAKFAFTRGISDALSLVSDWGEENGLAREDVSHLSIVEILEGRHNPREL
ncbi:MAG: hypothetical protein VX085_11195, partial [Pseudomonadota bacterium]|nr:hypothetical protein [Pseudomonadota bacterium]